MNKLFKGLMAAVLSLSCVGFVGATEKPTPETPDTKTVTFGEAWGNNWVKVSVVGAAGFICETGYLVAEKTGLLA